jgi:hypothetical protein
LRLKVCRDKWFHERSKESVIIIRIHHSVRLTIHKVGARLAFPLRVRLLRLLGLGASALSALSPFTLLRLIALGGSRGLGLLLMVE